ncbi:MAG: hypothetical protein HY000_37820 [Planctomycetes bacterium]|nr:hypothetical protein [Planctomycetota bacterium]
MKLAIRLSKADEAKALPILLRHSPGMILPDRTYVLSVEAVGALREAGVRFEELGTEADAPIRIKLRRKFVTVSTWISDNLEGGRVFLPAVRPCRPL